MKAAAANCTAKPKNGNLKLMLRTSKSDISSVLLLMVIDGNSRKILTYMLKFNIRKEHEMMLLSWLILGYRIAGFNIRNDNGSPFVDRMVRELLKKRGM